MTDGGLQREGMAASRPPTHPSQASAYLSLVPQCSLPSALTFKVFLPIAPSWLLATPGPCFLENLLKSLHAQGPMQLKVLLLLGHREARCRWAQALGLWLQDRGEERTHVGGTLERGFRLGLWGGGREVPKGFSAAWRGDVVTSSLHLEHTGLSPKTNFCRSPS